MKTTTRTMDELIASEQTDDVEGRSPLPIDVIPNHMGINLCSVEAITWTRQEDKQLVSLTIHFQPKNNP